MFVNKLVSLRFCLIWNFGTYRIRKKKEKYKPILPFYLHFQLTNKSTYIKNLQFLFTLILINTNNIFRVNIISQILSYFARPKISSSSMSPTKNPFKSLPKLRTENSIDNRIQRRIKIP